MNTEYVKYVAQQAGPFDQKSNVINFDIPADMYNLRDSFISLYTTVEGVDANVIGSSGGEGIYPTILKITGSDDHFKNASMVKNVECRSSARGQLENIRRVDQLYNAVQSFNLSQRQSKADEYLAANATVDEPGAQRGSIFQELIKEGQYKSRNVEAPIQIRCGDLMDLWNSSVYDGSKLGDLSVRVEMNLDGVFEGASAIETDYMTDVGIVKNFIDQTSTVAAVDLGSAAFPIKTGEKNITARQDTEEPLGYTSLSDSPFYVGQRILFSGQVAPVGDPGNPVPFTDVEVQITKLSFDEAKSQFSIETSPKVVTLTDIGDELQNLQIASVSVPNAVNVEYKRAEITMKRYKNTEGMPSSGMLAYSTFSTEEDVGPTGVAQFQRQYIVEPDADAVLLTFPQGTGNPFLSRNTNIQSTRLRLNQVDLTDRDVATDSPLYYDRLATVAEAMGYQLNNLQQNSGVATGGNAQEYPAMFPAGSKSVLVGASMPQSVNDKKLQVNIDAQGGDVPFLTLFKHKPRMLEY